MNRRSGVVVVGMVGIALIGLWWLRCGGRTAATEQHAATEHPGGGRATAPGRTVDPRTQAGGSISGRITDDAKAPIAGASVCASATAPQLPSAITLRPACSATDDQGHYKIANLLAADYALVAGAPQFRPGAFHPTPGSRKLTFALAAGETRTDVDVVLSRGAAEVTGVVRDIAGGPVAHAQVRAASRVLRVLGPAYETDDQGKFVLWTERGSVSIEARAEGYASGRASGNAPGAIDVALTPESSVAGRVVDAATDQPVSGARVELEGTMPGPGIRETEITDAQGTFRVERTTPGRFTAVATTDHGYGRSEGSTLVGLGQHVEGVVIRLYPAYRIEGRIVATASHRSCPDGTMSLNDPARNRWLGATSEQDGSLVVSGVIPGTYRAEVSCEGYARRDYPPITVRDADVTGQVWEVDEGARIRGKIVTRSGSAVDDATVMAQNVGGAARDVRDRSVDRSTSDGGYELAALKPGAYRIDVTSGRGVSPRAGYTVTVAAAATVEQDLVLEDGGKVTGTVVDEAGKPVPDVRVDARGSDRSSPFGGSDTRTDASGAFTIEALRAGDYRISARRRWDLPFRKPGSAGYSDGEGVTVRAGETATVKLVVESETGTITGTVVDAAGKPVSDAFISSAREYGPEIHGTSSVARTRNEGWGEDGLVLTSTDGGFTLSRLGTGTYAVRAYRKGGGEAVAEHVAVGATVKLQIKPTGSIEGTVRGIGAALQDLNVSVHDEKTGLLRSERFYRTGGHFALHDLPAGHFEVGASGEGGHKMVIVDLADGEVKTGVELTLETFVTVTGRLVDHFTQKPIPRFRVFVHPVRAAGSSTGFSGDFGPESITDEDGKFAVARVSLGQILITAMPEVRQPGGESEFVNAARMVTGSGTVDLGDIRAVRPRVKRGEPRGKLGIRLVERRQDGTFENDEQKIAEIDPAGAAAKTALRVGDVITSCDGIDVTGENVSSFFKLVQAPPGTKLTLGTKRGVTVTVVLAP